MRTRFDESHAIGSIDDPRVADYRLLADPASLLQAGLFVAEGRLVLQRIAGNRRFRVRSVLVTKTAHAALSDALARLDPAVPVLVVDRALMSAVAGFAITRGCLALVERPAPLTLETLDLAAASRLLALEGVSNPDNVGGLFRSAAAFGVDAVLIGPGCGDPFYRKAVRTSMAGTLSVPFAGARPWPEALDAVRARGFQVLALTPAADARPLDTYPRDLARVLLAVGAEGDGLSAEAMTHCDDRVRIPMPGSADSLNVAVAASIALWHFSGPGRRAADPRAAGGPGRAD